MFWTDSLNWSQKLKSLILSAIQACISFRLNSDVAIKSLRNGACLANYWIMLGWEGQTVDLLVQKCIYYAQIIVLLKNN